MEDTFLAYQHARGPGGELAVRSALEGADFTSQPYGSAEFSGVGDLASVAIVEVIANEAAFWVSLLFSSESINRGGTSIKVRVNDRRSGPRFSGSGT